MGVWVQRVWGVVIGDGVGLLLLIGVWIIVAFSFVWIL